MVAAWFCQSNPHRKGRERRRRSDATPPEQPSNKAQISELNPKPQIATYQHTSTKFLQILQLREVGKKKEKRNEGGELRTGIGETGEEVEATFGSVVPQAPHSQ